MLEDTAGGTRADPESNFPVLVWGGVNASGLVVMELYTAGLICVGVTGVVFPASTPVCDARDKA